MIDVKPYALVRYRQKQVNIILIVFLLKIVKMTQVAFMIFLFYMRSKKK